MLEWVVDDEDDDDNEGGLSFNIQQLKCGHSI